MLGSLELLADSALEAAEENLVKSARASGQDLLVILNEIMDFSKIEAGKLQLEVSDFDLGELIDGLRDFWSDRAAEKTLLLDFRIAPQVGRIRRGDPGRLRQMLHNLLGNAIKFTDRGSVRLVVGPAPEDLAGKSPNRLDLIFEVIDSGVGIDATQQPHVFEAFEQCLSGRPDRAEGVGLGLAIIKRLAGLMDGALGFESKPGEGSRFWFALPLPEADPPPEAENWPRDLETPCRGAPLPQAARVLVAEDNATNQMVVRQMLERLGCRVDIVEDGHEAVTAVRSWPYDLVFMDISMPGLGGVEATRRIRKLPGTAGETPIYAFTAYAMKSDHDDYLAEGMQGVVTKPVSKEQLAAALLEVMAADGEPPMAAEPDRSRRRRTMVRSSTGRSSTVSPASSARQ